MSIVRSSWIRLTYIDLSKSIDKLGCNILGYYGKMFLILSESANLMTIWMDDPNNPTPDYQLTTLRFLVHHKYKEIKEINKIHI